ncbi:MAG TPA: hypothetical protein VM555_02510 [Tahibacter sp.]|nr:hypothetical protein [Tahibacter sp.]
MRPSFLPPRLCSAFVLAAAGLFAAWSGAVAAAEPASTFLPNGESLETSIETTARADGVTQIRLRGNWPSPCLPSVESATLAGRDIRIALRSNKALCVRYTVPFDVTIDPASALGRPLETGVYRVSLYAANGQSSEQELRGFALLEIGTSPPVRAESGFWWPDASREEGVGAAGTGVGFEVHDNTLAAAVFGFDTQGEQAWYFGTGTLRAKSASLDLVGMHGGSPLFEAADSQLAADASLVFHVEFESSARATVWFGRYERGANQPKLRLRSIAIVRQALTPYYGATNWDGEWVLLRESAAHAPMAERFHLATAGMLDFQIYQLAGDGYVLRCARDRRTAQVPPERCRLEAGGQLIGEFDSVGINRLDGYAPDGTRVQMLRVDRR